MNFRAADHLRRIPSPMTPATPVAVHRTPPRETAVAPQFPPRIQLVDRPAGDSVALSPTFPGVVEVVVPAPTASLLRSISNVSSVPSFLSLHHSDDDVFEAELDLETPLPSPAIWETTAEVTSSSTASSSPVTASSELESEATATCPWLRTFLSGP